MGTLSALAIPKVMEAIDRAKVAKAIAEIRAIQADLAYLDARDSRPASLAEIGWGAKLDPWGRPYQYFPFPPRRDGRGKQPPAGARRDRFLVLINSTYDLYSMGLDGASVPALTATASHDDAVRANDGGFMGEDLLTVRRPAAPTATGDLGVLFTVTTRPPTRPS